MDKALITLLIGLLMLTNANASTLDSVVDAKTLETYMQSNFQYKSDWIPEPYVEFFQSPEEFERTKAGDCDDFGIYANDKLRAMGYQSDIYIVRYIENNKWVGHAIAVFKDGDTYSIFSNQQLIVTKETDPRSAVVSKCPTWKLIYRIEPHVYGLIPRKDWRKMLRNVYAKDTLARVLFLTDFNSKD